MQRPLEPIRESSGVFIRRGIAIKPIDRKKKWHFHPDKKMKRGTRVSQGTMIGYVEETSS